MDRTQTRSRQKSLFFLLSPVVVVAFCQALALSLKGILGAWVWAPLVGLYWLALAGLILAWGEIRHGRASGIMSYLAPSRGGWLWKILLVLLGLAALPMMFLPNYRLLFGGVQIWLPYLALALLNPWLEELYWRGLVLEATASWPRWLGILYSAVFFALNHLAFAWTSAACRNPVFLANTFVVGLLFGVAAWKLKSLRWPVFAHFLLDLFSLSVPVFLNLYKIAA